MSERGVSEQEFQSQITQLAELYGWTWMHVRPLRTAHGWRVPTSGPLASGWPDLVLTKPGHRPLAVELKRQGQHPTDEQLAVLQRLSECGWQTRVWWPSDWDIIQAFIASREDDHDPGLQRPA